LQCVSHKSRAEGSFDIESRPFRFGYKSHQWSALVHLQVQVLRDPQHGVAVLSQVISRSLATALDYETDVKVAAERLATECKKLQAREGHHQKGSGPTKSYKLVKGINRRAPARPKVTSSRRASVDQRWDQRKDSHAVSAGAASE